MGDLTNVDLLRGYSGRQLYILLSPTLFFSLSSFDNDEMARKRVVSSDTTKKAVAAATSAVADSATEAKPTTSPSHKDGQPNATLPPQRQNRAQEPRALSLPLLVLLIILPLVSLLWDSECPSRPFALVRTRSTASTGGSSTRLVNPRILLVTAHPSDEVLFAPTVLALLTEEKKKNSELWTVSLSSGSGSASASGIGEGVGEVRKVELAKSWNVMGLSRERRVVLDVPYVISSFFFSFSF